jgi:acetylornithine deacetylase/succinyl-diaminopimelate desuccinylase-like protein
MASPVTALVPSQGSGFEWAPVEAEALKLFQSLIRFDTTNPPGDELLAANFVADALRKDGLAPVVLESAPKRGNVVVRYRGDGSKPPLLLNAHLDVVEAEAQSWDHPPFGGEIHDGYVWGRGAVDMKHMAAMSVMVLKLLQRTGAKLKRDVIFTAVADEEAGSTYGAEFLVERHRELVECEYAIGEIGGFSLHIGGVTYYPIQTAQKGTVWGRMHVHGPAGHGSMPRPDTVVVKLAQLIEKLGTMRLPQHDSKPVREMVEGLAKAQKLPLKLAMRGLLNPMMSKSLLKLFPSPSVARAFSALLSNTATPTVVRAGSKVNVIPGHASVEFDGRTLPGQTKEDLLRELREVVGPDAEFEVFDSTPPVETSKDTELFRSLSDSIRRADPNGVPIPYVIPGFTDARAFNKLGAKYYGFAPIRFDPAHKVAFAELYHGHNERCPVDGFNWGLRLLYDAVKSFCE